MKYPEAAPYVTQDRVRRAVCGGSGHQQGRLQQAAAGDPENPEGGRAKAWTAAADKVQLDSGKAGFAMVGKGLPNAKSFVLPAEEQKSWANAMPNIAKEWAARSTSRACPAARSWRPTWMRCARPASSRRAIGTSERRPLIDESFRGNRSAAAAAGGLNTAEAPPPGASPVSMFGQLTQVSQHRRHAADSRHGGRGQCRHSRPRSVQSSGPGRDRIHGICPSSPSSFCRWRTRCAKTVTSPTI